MTSSAQPTVATGSRVSTRGLLSDPLAPIWALGKDTARVGIVFGIIGALLLHAAIGAQAASTLGQVHAFAVLVRAAVRERQRMQIDIDMTEAPPPEAAPAPEAQPEPKAQPAPVTPAAPTPPSNEPPPPPAAAEAGKILAQEPDPNQPVDLTGDGFVTGNGDHFVGGVTASNGTSTSAVHDLRAQPNGIGKAPPGPVASTGVSNLMRAASPVGGNWNDCEFPPEADVEGIDSAVVQLTVTVGTDGRAKSVTVLRDPGNGFGQAVRSCAFRKQFTTALDRSGAAIVMSTAPFTVRFTR
jgi:protein TonB